MAKSVKLKITAFRDLLPMIRWRDECRRRLEDPGKAAYPGRDETPQPELRRFGNPDAGTRPDRQRAYARQQNRRGRFFGRLFPPMYGSDRRQAVAPRYERLTTIAIDSPSIIL